MNLTAYNPDVYDSNELTEVTVRVPDWLLRDIQVSLMSMSVVSSPETVEKFLLLAAGYSLKYLAAAEKESQWLC